ncbi:MAG TPA: acetolactate synthase [bacterium]|nr:acetolactate synthase [bacterium]
MGALRQISVFAKNQPGKLENICRVLAQEKVNILALNIASSGKFGVIKFIVDDTDRATTAFEQAGFTVAVTEVLAIAISDRPGGLHAVADALQQQAVNIDNAYVLIPQERAIAYFVVETDDIAAARRKLAGAGLTMYDGN